MVGHSPVFQILLQIEIRMSVVASPPAWTNSAGMLSTPAGFPIFSALTAVASRRIGWCFSSRICVQSSSIGSQRSEQYSVHQLRISFSSMRHFSDLSCMVVDLPCFSVARSLTSWYICYSFWGMLPHPGTDPVSKSLLPSLSLSWSFF